MKTKWTRRRLKVPNNFRLVWMEREGRLYPHAEPMNGMRQGIYRDMYRKCRIITIKQLAKMRRTSPAEIRRRHRLLLPYVSMIWLVSVESVKAVLGIDPPAKGNCRLVKV